MIPILLAAGSHVGIRNKVNLSALEEVRLGQCALSDMATGRTGGDFPLALWDLGCMSLGRL